jgi:hypothetical protein
MTHTHSKLRTFVGQLDGDSLLDLLSFVQVVGGAVERIRPMDDGRYSVVLQHEQLPLLAEDLAALTSPDAELTSHDLAMMGVRACVPALK